MPLTAVHAHAGLLDVTLGDLGAPVRWESLHRAQPPAPLTCRACSAPMSAKMSKLGQRFFAHRAGGSDCPTGRETIAHRLLKVELASAVRAAGWHAELEVPGRGWRADVLATRPDGGRRFAWEAQLASIRAVDLQLRTSTMAADDVEVCWVTDKDVPWLTQVPSIRITEAQPTVLGPSDPVRSTWDVVDGTARFTPVWCFDRSDCQEHGWISSTGTRRRMPCPGHGSWSVPAPVPLARFIAAVFTERLQPHERHRGAGAQERASRNRTGRVMWTAPSYVQLATEQASAFARREALEEQLSVDEVAHREAVAALLSRQHLLVGPAREFLSQIHGRLPTVPISPLAPRWAKGSRSCWTTSSWA